MKRTPVNRAYRRPSRALFAGAVVAAATLAAGACTHRPPHRPPTTTRPPVTSPANEVTFVLKNGAIEQQGEVKPGRNTVHVTNIGTIEHEVIFIAAEGGATLPIKADGSVDEAKLPAGSDIGEVELEAGESATKTFTFRPGKWVAVCNIVNGSKVHFAAGMWMDFTVV